MTEKIQDILGYRFQEEELLKQALTHSSVKKKTSYERLEFLGDRVLGLVIARFLFETFPEENEGDLAKRHAALVQRDTLSMIAQNIHLGDFITLSQGEEETGGRKKEAILADVMESLFGAIYLDGSFDIAEKIIQNLFKDIITQHEKPPQDPKTELQEVLQAEGKDVPVYEVTSQTGPSHAPTFEIEVRAEGYPAKKAVASSKRAAEKKAAELLLEEIRREKK